MVFITNVSVIQGHSTDESKAAAATTLVGAATVLGGLIIGSNPVTLVGAGITVLGAAIWTSAEFSDGSTYEQPTLNPLRERWQEAADQGQIPYSKIWKR